MSLQQRLEKMKKNYRISDPEDKLIGYNQAIDDVILTLDQEENNYCQEWNMPKIRPELKEFMLACEAELKRHDTEKGDSWKEMELPSLITLFSVAMANWYDKPIKSQENNDQLIDIANFAMMLWYRQKAK